ncbi:MAG TPA: xanthine dehydrogenase family protein molybdopterin-binding subunit [Acidimicrobiales bacterium]|nr:xanthine dehydrogenase family protein molybdopterin-binding subunit [Acidimicrobiales bacterium]
MSILGNRVLRTEDPAFLTTGGTYVADVELPPGALHVVYVRSTMAHARIDTIDVDEAKAAPGVVDVVTAADVDLADQAPSMGLLNQAMVQPVLARGVVRFVGEPIVAIVAESVAAALDASELVFVDYDPLPAVIDPDDALTSEVLVHTEAGTNLVMELEARKLTADFADCEVVVSQRVMNQRVAPAPIEARVAAAYWGDDGRLVHYASCQGAHPIREALASGLGIDEAQIRVISPDVGGGFGAKARLYPEELLLGWLARRVGRPVRWAETRSENLVGMGHGRAQVQQVEMGGTRDGRITAYRLTVLQDAGAYPSMGAVLPWMTRTMLTGVYDLDNAEFSSRSVATNTTPTVAYRGAGRPEAAAAIERAVDLFATEIGMDPAEVRRRNFLTPDRFPLTTVAGTPYDSGDYEGALDKALAAAGYDDLRAEQRRRREAGAVRQLGIGLSVYVEITAGGGGSEYGSVELLPDGTVLAKTGSSPYGQGHHTAWAMLVADRLGLSIDDVTVVHGDTDLVPTGGVTGGSRSVQIAGSSIRDAADRLSDLARDKAADLLEAAVDDVVHDTATRSFHVAGTPARAVSWADVAAATADDENPLVGVSEFSQDGATFPFGAHVAVVEVDTDTGGVELVRLVACDDAGTLLNPLLAEGQVHGGLAQGAAQALLEEVRFDADGNPLTATFADYGIISATELPAFERVVQETPTHLNPLGAKGIGESGTIGATPAVHNAVIDAVAHLGVRHIDMPCTAEKVWRAIQEASAAG